MNVGEMLGLKRLPIVALGCMLFAHPAEAADLQGTVIAVDGDDVTVRFEAAEALQPAVGDSLYVSEPANEDGNALGVPGKWTVTEVRGDIVKARGSGLLAGHRPEMNMVATINVSPAPVPAGEPPHDTTAIKPAPAARGKVITKRGRNVTIKLSEKMLAVARGDIVELSYSYGDDEIAVGTWRVTSISDNGTLEAEPIEAGGEPNIGFDADIFSSGAPKEAEQKTDSEEKSGGAMEATQKTDRILDGQPLVLSHEPLQPENYRQYDDMDQYISSIQAKVASLKFYEGGFGRIPVSERRYGTTFSKSSARTVWWELRLEHQSFSDPVHFGTAATYWNIHGTGQAHTKDSFTIPAGSRSSRHASGYGWKVPGNWEPGLYRVDIFIGGKKAAHAHFTVTK